MVKSRLEYKKRIAKALDEIPPSCLSSVLDFIEYLRDKEAWKETQEILRDKESMLQIRETDREWNEGNCKKGDYVEWRRGDV
ncbi:MAG: hypothetical protein FJ012_08060 [Chloroflexi bacterium]|nr:hypothetical protein [Chloroflexota bacterium]